MPEFDSERLKKLIEAFKSAEEQVQTVLLNTDAKSVEDYKFKVDKKLDKVSVSLMRESIDWAEKDLPKAYREGEKRTDSHLESPHAVSFGKLTDAAIETPYIELARHTQYANDYQKEIIDKAIIEAEKEGYGATVEKVKNIIQDTLAKDNASMIVQYSNGTKMPLDKYAEMLARTSRIETANKGSFDRCRKLGIDLVRCTKVPNCCPYCQMYEDKVYSVSGNDTRFPALYETALQRGYDIMHPNCRHEFIPFIEEFYTDEEMNELIKNSNHFEELNPDNRLFKIYNRNQALLRQYNEERHEFNKLKATLGDNMPYSTLGGFRRARRANTEQYEKTKKRVRNYEITEKDKQIVDFYKKKGYNDLLFQERLKDLQRQYLEKVDAKTISDVGFHKFAKTFVQTSNELIGQKTSDGRLIKGITVHLPERIIGDGTKAHLPIPLEKVKDVLFNGKVEDSHEDSVIYIKDGIRVSFSITKNHPIQCNYSDKKVENESIKIKQ